MIKKIDKRWQCSGCLRENPEFYEHCIECHTARPEAEKRDQMSAHLILPNAEIDGEGIITNPLPNESRDALMYRHALRKACAIGFRAAQADAKLNDVLDAFDKERRE